MASSNLTVKTSMFKVRAKQVVVDSKILFEPGFVLADKDSGCIIAVGGDEGACPQAAACDLEYEADIVVPGFIDIHTHGIGGDAEISRFWANPGYTQARVVKYGTTALLATMIFPIGVGGEFFDSSDLHCQPCDRGDSSVKRRRLCVCDVPSQGLVGWTCICQAAAPKVAGEVVEIASKLRAVVGKLGRGAVIEGIHAEGPIVESLGALPPADSAMSSAAFRRLLDMLGSSLKVMTIAPSAEAKTSKPFERLRMLLDRGIVPAFGHDTKCTIGEIAAGLREAAARGVVPHVTHAFNVQRFHHRDCGLGNVSLLPRLPNLPIFAGIHAPPTIELVCDSAHVSPLVLQAAVACKPTGTACFITDGIAEPVRDLSLDYADRQATVEEVDGHLAVYATSAENGKKVLCGSCAMMLDGFRLAVNVLNVGLGRAVDLCSCTPAAIAGLSHIGSLQVGKRADLVLLSADLKLEKVFVAGNLAYEAVVSPQT